MTPRNTQLGASAAARKAPVRRAVSAASSARTPANKKPSPRAETPSRPKRDASWFRWWLLPIFVVGAVAIFVISFYPVARVQYRETRQRAQLQAEYNALEARNQKLGVQVARLKTNEGIEDYARSQLGMVKKGEHVVIVTDGTEPTQTTLANAIPQIDSQEETRPPAGPWTAFLDAFFGVQ